MVWMGDFNKVSVDDFAKLAANVDQLQKAVIELQRQVIRLNERMLELSGKK